MKKTPIILLIISFVVEVIASIFLIGRMDRPQQDTVAVNECLKSVEANFGDETKYSDARKFAVIDNDGKLLYKNADSISTTVNEAIKYNDTILDIVTDGYSSGDANTSYTGSDNFIAGKILIHNDSAESLRQNKKSLALSIIIISLIQLIIFIAYFLYIKKKITDPFEKLKDFSSRVAQGNLDIPLNVDRGHVFGSFTESFDIMRSELKRSREAEKKAIEDKKEMVAKLSHDIKTPIASIKSTSEIGYELTGEDRTKQLFNQINIKADQLTNLADNLFHSSVADITEIPVNPSKYGSGRITEMIKTADYLNKCGEFEIPACDVFIDRLRLQQSFDNIFVNSYKYAGTEIKVTAEIEDKYLRISISDYGPGVSEHELPLLKEKYKRGSNTAEKEGAGLGLYLTDYFLEKMDGKLKLSNEAPGFTANIYLRII